MSHLARLADPRGRFLELEVINYEFVVAGGDVSRMGNVEVGGSDANWLLVKLRASDGTQTWKSISPALEDADLPVLADWAHDLADDAASVTKRWGATEPNLRLVGFGSGAKRTVRVELSQEWRRPGTDIEDDPSVIELTVDPDELLQFASEIESISLHFPVRPAKESMTAIAPMTSVDAGLVADDN